MLLTDQFHLSWLTSKVDLNKSKENENLICCLRFFIGLSQRLSV